jgi:hypothetical protein
LCFFSDLIPSSRIFKTFIPPPANLQVLGHRMACYGIYPSNYLQS